MPTKTPVNKKNARAEDLYLGRNPVGEGSLVVDPVWGVDTGDRDVWAKNLVRSKRAQKNEVRTSAVELETAITGIHITDTIVGSSTVTLTIEDPDWKLVDTGFFDVNDDGKLDRIDCNYPDGSDLWWRCTQIEIAANRAGAKITMTFMERAVAHLLGQQGPKKARRGKVTRAQFLKSLCDEIKAGGGIHFRCKQLKVKQKILDPEDTTPQKPKREKKKDKDAGLNENETLQITNWDGGKYTLQRDELANASEVIQACDEAGASEKATVCALAACIVEGPFFRNPSGGDLDSVGILQLRSNWGSQQERMDIGRSVRMFLQQGFYGKRDKSAKGAIDLARRHPDWNVGEICQETQGSDFPERYQKVADSARKVLETGGGPATGSHSEKQPYNFEVGTLENPREKYWDAMQRLGVDEVKWALFCDGQNIYFDPETSLIRQVPAKIITRRDPSLISFRANWDVRKIATEATLELICEPFEFRAGDVFRLDDFGPASTGSTAKLPGRWLVSEIDRDRFSLVSSFTLKQPQPPGLEPANEYETVQEQEDTSRMGGPKRDRIVEAAKQSLSSRTGYNHYSMILPGIDNDDPTPSLNARSDCSQWVHAIYLKAGCPSPGLTTLEQMAKGHKTNNPLPGDLLISSHHVELFIGHGKTIGHGTPEINYADVSDFPGFEFYTFDFLDQPKDKSSASTGTVAHGREGGTER